MTVTHSSTFLKNTDPFFWFSSFVRLFPRGDCLERCQERLTRLSSESWAKCLLDRADFPLWHQDVEFVASLYNVFLRRDQIRAVELGVRNLTAADAEAIESTCATDLVATALATGDVNSVRAVLRKKDLEPKIRRTFNRMQMIQRNVRGSEAERDNIFPRFTALRIWSGCASLFFILNPQYIQSPITLLLLTTTGEQFHKEFSLDLTDA